MSSGSLIEDKKLDEKSNETSKKSGGKVTQSMELSIAAA